MDASSLVTAGQIIEFDYPVRNLVTTPLEFVRRVVEVESCRSLFDSPLRLEAIEQRPWVRRGGLFVIGIDLHIQQRRQFYLDACFSAQLPEFRIGAFDPNNKSDTVETEWLSHRFPNTKHGRSNLIAELQRLDEYDFGHWEVAAFAVRP